MSMYAAAAAARQSSGGSPGASPFVRSANIRQSSVAAKKQPLQRRTKLGLYQHLPLSEQARRKIRSNLARQDEREDLAAVELDDETVQYRMTKSLTRSLENLPIYDLSIPNPGAGFFKVFSPEVLEQSIHHSYDHHLREGGEVFLEPLWLSPRDVAVHLLGTIHIWIEMSRAQSAPATTREQAYRRDREVLLPSGETVSIQSLLPPYSDYKRLRGRFYIPPGLMEGPITDNLRSFIIDMNGALNIWDEKKKAFFGHCDVIHLVKGIPCLWIMQVACPLGDGAEGPFMWGMRPHYSKLVDKTKIAIAEWVVAKKDDMRSALVMDSYYSAPEVLHAFNKPASSAPYFGKKQEFLTSLNMMWYKTLDKKINSELVDEGDSVTASVGDDLFQPPQTDAEAQIEKNKELIRQLELQNQLLSGGENVPEIDGIREGDLVDVDIDSQGDSGGSGGSDGSGLRVKTGQRNGIVISAHWARQQNVKAVGVRVVASNAFVRNLATRQYRARQNDGKSTHPEKQQRVAVPNTIYSSMYGVGSDLYNTNATRTSSKNKKRSHGSNYELSDHCVETVALSNQHYFQMRGFHRVDATQKNAFQDAFVGYGDDLRGGMIHAIRTMPDEKVLPTNPGKGCACGDCLVFDKDTILRYQAQADEEEEKLRLKQQQEREKVEKKIARTKAREQKARDAAERKRKREERQEQRERDELQKAAEKKQSDKAKQDTEKQEAAGKKQRVKAKQETEKRKAAAKAGREERNPECSFCENTAPKARMLKCSKRRCKKISCASCHGLRGRQASGSRRAEWVCKDCLPKTASAGQSQHSSTRRSSQGAARQTSRRSAASGSSSGRSRSRSASREKLPLIFA